MALPDLAAQSSSDVALPVGKWVCLGLVLSTSSGSVDNDRVHYLALKLVQVGAGEYAAFCRSARMHTWDVDSELHQEMA